MTGSHAVKPLMCLVLIFAVQTAVAAVPDPVFYLPFDGNPRAEKATGNPQPLAAREIDFGPGLVGEAVQIGQHSVLEYSAPSNVRPDRGTITLWYRPNWDSTEQPSTSSSHAYWRTLFCHKRPADRIGSGALWFWFWGGSLRADTSQAPEDYILDAATLRKNVWYHFAFTWGSDRQRMYIDGREIDGKADSYSPLRPVTPLNPAANAFPSFYIANHDGSEQAQGGLDEIRIYDVSLNAEQVRHDMARIVPVRMGLSVGYIRGGVESQVECRLTNLGSAPVSRSWNWQMTGPGGWSREGKVQLDLSPGASHTLPLDIPAMAPGLIHVEVAHEPELSIGLLQAEIWVLAENPLAAPPGETLRTTLLEEINPIERVSSPTRYSDIGKTTRGQLAGEGYLEAGPAINDRFAIRLDLPEADVPYLLEILYPDDKKRTMEILAQSSADDGGEFMMRGGVMLGDEYRNSGEMRTFRCILWARSRDTTLIFMTEREGAPAAVSRIRVSRIEGGLPAAEIHPAPPVAGWNRTVAMYYEDPAVPHSFGKSTGLMPDFQDTVQRMAAYMAWSGQNMLLYPVVWYLGPIGNGYNPRGHAPDFVRLILSEFEKRDLTFMGTINLHNIPLAKDVVINEKTVVDGSLHDTPVMIYNTGQPNPGRWHGTSPNFNPLHPATQAFLTEQVDRILDTAADSSAFKGLVLHLTRHTTPWFGHIEAGYNDYNIEQFEEETGIRVPVTRDDPVRGRLYYDWLMKNAREEWIAWRCRKLAAFYRRLADRISARRPDLRLGLFSYSPAISELNDPSWSDPGFSVRFNRESGLDPALYADADNILFAQTMYPADYRHFEGRNFQKQNPENHAKLLDFYTSPETCALLEGARFPWINLHDRYWENAVGAKSSSRLSAPWLNETVWRVSTLNPGHRDFLRHYILPLRHQDQLGFSKGGFLVGTHGAESFLVEFARAFRALPAVLFDDVPFSSETIRVRMRVWEGDTWFYVVNTADTPASITIAFAKDNAEVRDLSNGHMLPPVSGPFAVALEPFQLRSYRIQGASAITVR